MRKSKVQTLACPLSRACAEGLWHTRGICHRMCPHTAIAIQYLFCRLVAMVSRRHHNNSSVELFSRIFMENQTKCEGRLSLRSDIHEVEKVVANRILQ